MPPKKKPAKKKPARKLLRRKLAIRPPRVPSLADQLGQRAAVRQLALPHVPPPKPAKVTPEQLAASTVQTLRVGRLRANRWQDAAHAQRRPFAGWAAIVLDEACDRAGLPPLPPGAR